MTERVYEKATITWLNESDKKESYVIYRLFDIDDDNPDKCCIGQTTRMLKDRIQNYTYIKPNPNRLVQHAINQFKHFTVEILCKCSSKEELNVKEEYYTLLYRSNEREFGYNDSVVNKKSDEYRRRSSESSKGKPSSMRGKKHSDTSRKKMSESHKGKTNIKCKSIPDNIIFDSVKLCVKYYHSLGYKFIIHYYLDNGKIHKKSGQTFIRIKD